MMDFYINSWYRLLPAASINPQLSMVGRPGVTTDQGAMVAFADSNHDYAQQWQLYPVQSSKFLLRTRASGPSAYLAIRSQNESQAHPVPRIRRYDETDTTMLWQVAPWGDGTFHFSSIVNGEAWYLEFVSPGAVEMHTNISKLRPGLAFTFVKLGEINNVAFSTVHIPIAGHVSTITTVPLPPSPSLKAHPPSNSISIQAFTTSVSYTSTESATITSKVTASPWPTPSTTGHPSPHPLSIGGALGAGVSIGVLGFVFFTALGLFIFQQWRKKQKSPESLHYRRAKLWQGFTPQHRASQWSIDSVKSISGVYVTEVPELPTPSLVLSSPRSERHFSWHSMITASPPGSPFWPQTPGSPPAELPI